MRRNAEPRTTREDTAAFFARRADDPDAQAAVFALFRASSDVFSYIELAALRPLGLTHAGFVLLMSLWSMGPLETRELARVLAVSRPAVVSATNTLERAGLVRRLRSADDRRLVTVELTPRGRALVARAQRATHDEERRLAAAFSREELRTLVRLLGRMAAAVRDARPPAITDRKTA